MEVAHREQIEPFVTKDGSSIREQKSHKLWNTGENRLVLLCCCAPPYSHEDTVLTGR